MINFLFWLIVVGSCAGFGLLVGGVSGLFAGALVGIGIVVTARPTREDDDES